MGGYNSGDERNRYRSQKPRYPHLTEKVSADFGETRVVQYDTGSTLKARIREAATAEDAKTPTGVKRLDELVVEASEKGWTSGEIARAALRDRGWAVSARARIKKEQG